MSFFEKASELVAEYPWHTAALVGTVVGIGVGVGYYSHGRETKATITALVSEKERLALSLKAAAGATVAPATPVAPAAPADELTKLKNLINVVESVPGFTNGLTPAEQAEYQKVKAVLAAMEGFK